MKTLSIASFLFVAMQLTASAASIDLTPGSSTNISGIQVTCSGGAQTQGNMFTCECIDTGRTDNPPPVRTFVRIDDLTNLNSESQIACGKAVYGDGNSALWGFARARNCRPTMM